MPTSFKITKLPDGRWVPAHPELLDKTYFSDDGVTAYSKIREALWNGIEQLFPGEYVLDDNFDAAKQYAFQRIDLKTSGFIEGGFKFGGLIFSCSERAQIRYNAMLLLASRLDYPLEINNLDDTARLTLNSAEDTQAFCLASAAFVRAQVDAGTVLKDEVRQMTTAEELDNFQDTRETPAELPTPIGP